MSGRRGEIEGLPRGGGLAAGLMAVALFAVAVCGGILVARGEPLDGGAGPLEGERVIGGYATSFASRSPGQIENAVLAADALDGAVIAPGHTFSFNLRVGSWTADRGYRRAPVSYDGELTLATGGGVCQTSTTLYGAALLAGMEIVERHRHFWPVNYARPGLDAAVAQPSIDLRFRNPLASPVRIRARRVGNLLSVELLSSDHPGSYSIEVEQIALHPPGTVVRVDQRLEPGQFVRSNQGQPGCDVAVYRVRHYPDGRVDRTLVSLDSYPTLNRIVKLGPPAPAPPADCVPPSGHSAARPSPADKQRSQRPPRGSTLQRNGVSPYTGGCP